MARARYGDVETARGGVQMLTEILRQKRQETARQQEADNAIFIAAAESGLYLDPDSKADLKTQYRDANIIRNKFGTMGEDGLKGFLNPLEVEQIDYFPASIGKQEQNNAIQVLDSMLKDDPRTERLREITFPGLEGQELEFAIQNATAGIRANKSFKTPTEETQFHVSKLAQAEPMRKQASSQITAVQDALKDVTLNHKNIKKSLKASIPPEEYKKFLDDARQELSFTTDADEDDIINAVFGRLKVSGSSGFIDEIYGDPETVIYFMGQQVSTAVGADEVAKDYPLAKVARTILQQSNILNDRQLMASYYTMREYAEIISGEKVRQSLAQIYEDSEKIKDRQQRIQDASLLYRPAKE